MLFPFFNRNLKLKRKLFKSVWEAIYDLQDEFEAFYDSGMGVPDLLHKAIAQIEHALELMDKLPAELPVLDNLQLEGLRTLFILQKVDIEVFLKDGQKAPILSRYYLTPR
jgi:hypothetical protein